MGIQLQGTREITWVDQLPERLMPSKVYFGRDESGVGEVQIAIATVQHRPTLADLQAAWKSRGTGLTTPVIVAAVLGEQVWLLGPSQSDSMLGPVPLPQAMRQLQSILDEVDAVAARQKMQSVAHSLDGSGGSGFVNHFLFASYHLRRNVPQRKDWKAATERSQSMLPKQGRDLIHALGYELETVGFEVNTLLLRASSGSRRAVAVLLDESQEFDRKSAAYQISPVAHGLEVAGREDVPWVIVLRKSTLRLYPGKDGVGVGQRGQSETYFELDLNDLDTDYAGLLTLIFAADALEQGGTAEQILEDSSNYAAELGTRLRDRVYVGVVPSIAVAISERLPQLGYQIDADGLKVAYALTLRVLFRLLFQAYGEDTGLLPAGRNESYDANSLQSFIRRDINADHSEYSPQAKSIWFDLEQVWDAIYNGNQRWAIPAYGGSLFDPETEEGSLLKRFELPDSVMGPALQNLLAEATEDGVRGPVDFRSLQVRDFGTIYEGLLESSLSVAEFNLSIDKNGVFVPAKPGDKIEVEDGRPYFHSSSGDRKATGSYYTPKIVVDYLIEKSITPTLTTHLNKVKALIGAGKDREAGELFWDFRVADLAMGSAHFLVAAVDKIERGMRDFLTTTPVPSVRAELERLAQKAREQLSHDQTAAENINDAQLLRRQVARRCVYGLDINPLAVELARLAIWIHTFVPGLPMSSLDHNLVLGNSLTGIGSVDEAIDAIVSKHDKKKKSVTKAAREVDEGLFGAIESLPSESGYQQMLRRALNDRLQIVAKLLGDVAAADESEKSEVQRNKTLLKEAREKALPARRIFDAAIATRLGLYEPEITREEHVKRLEEAVSASEAVQSLEPAHMPALFPEVFLRENSGFDVLIGNPPWEEVMVEEPKFWLSSRPGLLGLKPAELKKEIKRLRSDRADRLGELENLREQVAKLREVLLAGPFPGLGTGDVDLYQAFAWRNLQLMVKGGRLAMVTPRSLLNAAGGEHWRREVITKFQLDAVTTVNNKNWLFPIDPRFSVAFLVVEGIQDREHPVRMAGPFFSAAEFENGKDLVATISNAAIEAGSKNLAIPQLSSPVSGNVLAQIRLSPRLDDRSEDWDFRPVREFDATNDRKIFDSGPQTSSLVPVLGGAGFDLWQPITGETYAWGDPKVIENALLEKRKRQIALKSSSFYGLPLEWASSRETLPMNRPRIAFRDVTNATNTRTCIAALLPAKVALTNKAPYLFRRKGSEKTESYLLGILSSIPLDWYSRRYVELGMNLHIVNGLPIPVYESTNPYCQKIVSIAGRLSAVDDRFTDWAFQVDVPVGSVSQGAEKEELISELDALVSLLYGLNEDQIQHIFETFQRGWDYQPRLDSVLRHYANWKDQE